MLKTHDIFARGVVFDAEHDQPAFLGLSDSRVGAEHLVGRSHDSLTRAGQRREQLIQAAIDSVVYPDVESDAREKERRGSEAGPKQSVRGQGRAALQFLGNRVQRAWPKFGARTSGRNTLKPAFNIAIHGYSFTNRRRIFSRAVR